MDKRHCTGGAAVLIGTGIVIGILLLLVVVFAVCLVRKIRMLKAYRKGENPLEFISPTMHRGWFISTYTAPEIHNSTPIALGISLHIYYCARNTLLYPTTVYTNVLRCTAVVPNDDGTTLCGSEIMLFPHGVVVSSASA